VFLEAVRRRGLSGGLDSGTGQKPNAVPRVTSRHRLRLPWWSALFVREMEGTGREFEPLTLGQDLQIASRPMASVPHSFALFRLRTDGGTQVERS
jgi:hypothetical protein